MEQSDNETMIYLFLLFLEIVLLFFLSRIMSKTLSRFLPMQVLSFIFLPGVIIHEVSHMLVAAGLFVGVGDIEFSPKIDKNKLKLGSVGIAKTDPIRRAIIGFAPVFVGVLLILGIVYFFLNNPAIFQGNKIYITISIVLMVIYILFVISNTMFSSSADMEGTLEILIAILIIFTALYLIGFRFPTYFTEYLFRPEAVGLIKKTSMSLLAPIVIDLVILGGVRILSDKR